MSTADSVNIREIIARFQNSAEVIDELRTRLQSIVRTDDLHSASLQSTQRAADSLQSLSAGVRDATDALKVTLAIADSALTTATSFLAATDLSEFGRQLGVVTKQQDEMRDEVLAQIAALTHIVADQHQALRGDLVDTKADLAGSQAQRDKFETELEQARSELDALKAKVSALPERVRSKHGL